MVKINGINHLPISTANTKGQIEFFTDVLGAELVALFPMHLAEGARHTFLKLSETCCLSFVEYPENADIEQQMGVTYPSGAGPSAPGTLNHLAFNVDSIDDLLAMRDRIRSKGIHVFGPLDHGVMRSIYFQGPEHLSLEIAAYQGVINPEAWIDPETVNTAGISTEELVQFKAPDAYEGQGGAVAQPAVDPIKHHALFEDKALKSVIEMSDEEAFATMSTPNSPVSI
ncbi:MAG: VOC family protein [Cyanobacteria bacterium P01_E01_bin.6]